VVHLDELQEKYGAQGLTVLAVTNEARSAVDEFVSKTSAKHAIVIESTDSADLYEIRGYPSSFLIGPDGRILSVGNPGNDVIEEALKNVRLMPPEIPKKLEPIRAAMEKGKFPDAAGKVAKALLDPALAPEDKAVAEQLRDWIDWFSRTPIETAKSQMEAGDFYEASVGLAEAVKAFKGMPASADAAAMLKGIQADAKQKEEVAAGERLAKARAKAKEEDDPKKAIQLFKPIASKYESTKAGAKAKTIIEELEKKAEAEEKK
jgi:hypothetical protein